MILHPTGIFDGCTKASLRLLTQPNTDCAVVVLEDEARLIWQEYTEPGHLLIHVLRVPEEIGTPIGLKYDFVANMETICIIGEKGVLEMGTGIRIPTEVCEEITSIPVTGRQMLRDFIIMLRFICIRQNRNETWPDEPKEDRLKNAELQIINTKAFIEIESGTYKYQIINGHYKEPNKKGIAVAPKQLEESIATPLNVVCYLEITWAQFCTMMEAIGVIADAAELINE